MSKVKPATKEQLVYFLLQNISLGTYDKRFLNNLQVMHITPQKPVTSNQADLLDKITLRYFKQLKRKEIDANDMVTLSWVVNPIDSSPEYTDAYCTIKDSVIHLRSPFKKDFITELKDIELHLVWDKETKLWSAPFCELALKHFIDCLDKHYAVVHYCPQTTAIIKEFAEYESATCWDPTYKLVNGNYMICGINRPLNEAVSNVELNNSPKTLARLTAAGVKIDIPISDEHDKNLFEFITTEKPIVDWNDINTLVEYCVDIETDFVLICEAYRTGGMTSSALAELLKSKHIPHKVVDRKANLTDISLTGYEYPIVVNTALWGIGDSILKLRGCKVVHLGNSKVINVK